MGEGCGVAETAVASTVLPVHIIAALPNTIILVVADADAVVAAQVNTRVHIGGPVISTLEVVEVGVVLDLVPGLRLVVGRLFSAVQVAVAATAPSANAAIAATTTRPFVFVSFFGARSVDSSAGTVL